MSALECSSRLIAAALGGIEGFDRVFGRIADGEYTVTVLVIILHRSLSSVNAPNKDKSPTIMALQIHKKKVKDTKAKNTLDTKN